MLFGDEQVMLSMDILKIHLARREHRLIIQTQQRRKNKILAIKLLPNVTRHIFIIPSGGAGVSSYFCYTVHMPADPRIVTISVDGSIKLTPLDLQELRLTPGDEYVMQRQGDDLILTPLNLLPAQE